MMMNSRATLLCCLFFATTSLANGNLRPDEELNPLTLTWNQVHHLVRENLFEINELRKENTAILGALQHCVGFDSCLGGNNDLFRHSSFSSENDFNNFDNGAGALIASLNRRLLSLEEYQNQLEREINEKKDILYRQKVDNYRRQHSGWSQSGSSEHGTPRRDGSTEDASSQQTSQRTEYGSGWTSSQTGGSSSSSWSSSHGGQQGSSTGGTRQQPDGSHRQGGWSTSSSGSRQGSSSGGTRQQPDGSHGQQGWSTSTSGSRQGSSSGGTRQQTDGSHGQQGWSTSTSGSRQGSSSGGTRQQTDGSHGQQGWSTSTSGSRQGSSSGGTRQQPDGSHRQQGWSTSSSGSRQDSSSGGTRQQPDGSHHQQGWSTSGSHRQEYDDSLRRQGGIPEDSSGSSEERRRQGGGWSTTSSGSRQGASSYGRGQHGWSSHHGSQPDQQHGFSWNSVGSSGSEDGDSAYIDRVVIGGSGRRGSSWTSASQEAQRKKVHNEGAASGQGQGSHSSWSSSSHHQSGSGNNINAGSGTSSHSNSPSDNSQSHGYDRPGATSWSSQHSSLSSDRRRFGVSGQGSSSSTGSSSQQGTQTGGVSSSQSGAGIPPPPRGEIHGKFEEGSYWNSELRGESHRSRGSSSGAGDFDSQGNIPKSYEWSPSSDDKVEEGGAIIYGGIQQQGASGGSQGIGGSAGGQGVGDSQGGQVVIGGSQGGQMNGGSQGGQMIGGSQGGQMIGGSQGGQTIGGSQGGRVIIGGSYGGQGGAYGGQGGSYGGQGGAYGGQGGVYGGQGGRNGQNGVTWISSSSGSDPDGNGTIWTKTYSYSSNPDQEGGGYQGTYQNSSWSRSYSYSSKDGQGNNVFGSGGQVPGMQQGVFANGSSYVMIDPRQLGFGEGGNLINGSAWMAKNGNKNIIIGQPQQGSGKYGYSYQYSSSKSSSSNPYVNHNKDLQMTSLNNQQFGGIHKVSSNDQDPRGVSGKKK